jgi:hypothetical protein
MFEFGAFWYDLGSFGLKLNRHAGLDPASAFLEEQAGPGSRPG